MRRLGSHNWLWAIIVAGIICVLTITTRVTGPEFPVNTDVVSLMPEEKRDPLLAHAFDTSAKMLSSRIAFLIETNDSELADQAAFTLEQMLVDSRIFRPSAEEARELFDWLHDNRTELLCPRDRILLASGQGQSLEQSALGMIFAPLVPIPGEIIQSDPLLLSFRLIDCLSLSGNVPDTTRFVAGQLTTTPYA